MTDDRLTVDCLVAFRLIGVSRNTGYSLIKRGEFPLPVIKAGKRLLVPKIAITKLLGNSEDSNEHDNSVKMGESK